MIWVPYSRHKLNVVQGASLDSSVPMPDHSNRVQPVLGKLRWIGTCIHGYDTNEPGLPDPDRACFATINPQFSVIAIGTTRYTMILFIHITYAQLYLHHSGGLIIASFPLPGVTPKHIQPQFRIPSLAQTGAVKCAEWTADGYLESQLCCGAALITLLVMHAP